MNSQAEPLLQDKFGESSMDRQGLVEVPTKKNKLVVACLACLGFAVGLAALVLGSLSWSLLTTPRSITSYNLAYGAVTSDNIAYGAVISDNIAYGAVTSDQIASGSISHYEIADEGVWNENLAYHAVTSDKIAGGAVGSYQLAFGAVTTTEIADGAVNTIDIANNAVTSNKIATVVTLQYPRFMAANGHTFMVDSVTINGQVSAGVGLWSSTSTYNYVGLTSYPIYRVYASNLFSSNVYKNASYTAGLDRSSVQSLTAKHANLSAITDAFRRLDIEQSVHGEALLVAENVAASFPQATAAVKDENGKSTLYINKEIVYDAALVALQQALQEIENLRANVADLQASVRILLSQSA